MPLARLRHQMLLAMGLPACWVQQAPEPAAPPPPQARPAVGRFDPKACRRDTVPETVCGERDPMRSTDCDGRGANLRTLGQSQLAVTPADKLETFRGWAFDLDATERYRSTLARQNVVLSQACCYSSCTELAVEHALPLAPPPDFRIERQCIPRPPGGTTIPAPHDPRCPAGVRFGGLLRPYTSATAESCCYGTIVPDEDRVRVIKGRAARVDGEARYAGVGADSSWRSVAPVAEVPAELREHLAAAWLAAARMEHASIAAFSSLSLRLLVLGAPPELIAGVHAAALDEIEHARLAFELASAYAGAPVGPARFDDAARLATAGTVAELAVETLIDGCIGETVAAVEAERAAAAAEDPIVAEVLRRIAVDEARHAALAWAIVAWCARQDGSLAGELSAALERQAGPAAAASGSIDLARHGVLDGAAIAALRTETLDAVIAPCLGALLASCAPPAAA